MYTNVKISSEDALRIFDRFATSVHAEMLLSQSVPLLVFVEKRTIELSGLDARLCLNRAYDCFELRFGRFLPDLPDPLRQLGISEIGAEVVAMNMAPTHAEAGRYEEEGNIATVEHVVSQLAKSVGDGVIWHNVFVTGASVKVAALFFSLVCSGEFNDTKVKTHSFA